MKLPSKFRIKARVSYEVLFADEIRNHPECVGISDPNTRQVIFKKVQSDTSLLQSAIHEVLHCFEYEYDIKLSHESVYKLEEAIFKFITLNKLI